LFVSFVLTVCRGSFLVRHLPKMKKRSVIDADRLLENEQLASEQSVAKQRHEQLQQQSRTIYTATKKEMAAFFRSAGEHKAAVQRATPRPLNSLFTRVRKVLNVEFRIDLSNPAQLPPPVVQLNLGASFDPRPASQWELAGGSLTTPVHTDFLLLHNINLLSYHNELPFEVALSSNLTQYAGKMAETIGNDELFMERALEHLSLAEAEDIVDPNYSFLSTQPGPVEVSLSGKDQFVLKAQNFLKPDMAAACAGLSTATLDNGVYRFDSANPLQEKKHWVCMHSTHVLGVYVCLNWRVCNLIIRPLSEAVTVNNADRQYYLMDADTYQALSERILREMSPKAPRFPTDRLAFALTRSGLGLGWLSTRRCFPPTLTELDLQRCYQFSARVEIDYSLQPLSIANRSVVVPGYADLTIGFDNAKDHARFIEAKAESEALLKKQSFNLNELVDAAEDEEEAMAVDRELDAMQE